MPKLSKKRKEEIMKQFGGRMPTKKEIFQKIMESQERMAQALKGAWETKPDDPKVAEQLLEVGERSARLKKEIQRMFDKDKSR
ncbi:MAG: hypothetical protein HYY87_02110 [Candidatus Levybacteria bacterium]|nr:hypothetical protein [Candidatus Levybacteria bacterium]MBI2622561.1 hypothetical protein [Candidatus Levybacteria bacterium]MBI3070075.1 hypothetical protein [Candidatus Levybacteria bacterium]